MSESKWEPDYNLKCRVKKIKQTFTDIVDKAQHETDSILLIPDKDNTASWIFWRDWLPEGSKICKDCGNEDVRIEDNECSKCKGANLVLDYAELPAFIPHPVYSNCRLGILRKNNMCDEHHLFVMSSGAEKDLSAMDGKNVMVSIFHPDNDEMCDTAKDINRTKREIEI